MSDETTDPALELARAKERQTAANLQVAEAVADLARAVEPGQAHYVRLLKVQAATLTALHAVLEVCRVVLDACASLLRGWWGGPVAILVLGIVAALALVWAGWEPADVTGFTVGTVRAVRCGIDPPDPSSASTTQPPAPEPPPALGSGPE